MWARLRAWYARVRERRYPLIRVDWGERLEGDKGALSERGCGHWSRSYVFDPVREESLCLACYRLRVGKERRR